MKPLRRSIFYLLAICGISTAQPIAVHIPDSSGVVGTTINLPVLISPDVSGFDIYSFQFTLCFDSRVIHFINANLGGTMSEGWDVTLNNSKPDTLRLLAFSGTTPLTGNGVLLFLSFDLIGNASEQTPLQFCPPDSFFFNAGQPDVALSNGSLTLRSEYWISISSVPPNLNVEVDGVLYVTPQRFEWLPGTVHSLTAPSPQYDGTGLKFIWNNWSDQGTQSHDFSVTGDSSLTANFDVQFELVVSASPDTGGSITLDPAGPWFAQGTAILLTAVENPSHVFTGWSGDLSGATNPENLVMDGPKNIVAHFGKLMDIAIVTIPESLQIRIDDTTWQPSPWLGQWLVGSEHTIETNPLQPGATGVRYSLESWSDGGTFSHSVICPDTSTTYMARFIIQYLLTTHSVPENGGVVVSSPDKRWHNSDSTIVLSAVPNDGYVFAGWSGDLSGTTNPAQLLMDTSKTVQADFQPHACVTYDFPEQGWYLISLPVAPVDFQVTSLFPTAINGIAFEWMDNQTSYNPVTQLQTQKGYWIAIDSADTVEVCGTPLSSFTKSYSQGWFLIGSVLGGADFSDPNDTPDDSVLTPAFGWTPPLGPYQPSIFLNEKEAYWIAVMGSCQLTIASSQNQNVSSHKQSERILWNSFIERFGSQPPPPPKVVEFEQVEMAEPSSFKLAQNRPNPFNAVTVIEFAVPREVHTVVQIYDVRGAKVRSLLNGRLGAGRHRIVWDSHTDDGREVPSGLYIVQVKADNFVDTIKSILIR